MGDFPYHMGEYLDRDDEWNIRYAIVQLFQPGTLYNPPAKRPNRAPRTGGNSTLLPRINQTNQVSVLRNSADGNRTDNGSLPKLATERGSQRPLLVAVTGQRGVGKTTTLAHIVSDTEFLQKVCKINTVIWLNASGINDEDTFFEGIASKIGFNHPKDSRLKMRDILPSVMSNLRQAVLLVVDDATSDTLDWFSLIGSKSFRCVFIFRGETKPQMIVEQVGLQMSKESIIIEHVDLVEVEDLLWLLNSTWRSDLAMPPGLSRESLLRIASYCQGLPITASLAITLLERCTSTEQTEEIIKAEDGDAYQTLANLSRILLERENEEFAKRLFWLLAFEHGQPITVDDLALVWNCQRSRAKLFCVDLADKGVVIPTSLPSNKTNKMQEKCQYIVQRAIFDALESNLLTKFDSVAHFIGRQMDSEDYKHPKLQMSRPGENLFHVITRVGHVELFRTIVDAICTDPDMISTLEKLCREQERVQLQTPLHFLFERCSQDSWELLSQIGERLSSTDCCTAVKDKKNHSITELAIVDLNSKRIGSGQTLLMTAARQMCQRFVNQILDIAREYLEGSLMGSLIDARDDYGRTVLHQQSAEEGGNVEMVSLLLEYGADIEAVDNKRRTPLHYVARFGCIDVCITLLENNCEVQARDDCGKTPLMLAKIARHYGIIKLLEGHQLSLNVHPHPLANNRTLMSEMSTTMNDNGIWNQQFVIMRNSQGQLVVNGNVATIDGKGQLIVNGQVIGLVNEQGQIVINGEVYGTLDSKGQLSGTGQDSQSVLIQQNSHGQLVINGDIATVNDKGQLIVNGEVKGEVNDQQQLIIDGQIQGAINETGQISLSNGNSVGLPLMVETETNAMEIQTQEFGQQTTSRKPVDSGDELK